MMMMVMTMMMAGERYPVRWRSCHELRQRWSQFHLHDIRKLLRHGLLKRGLGPILGYLDRGWRILTAERSILGPRIAPVLKCLAIERAHRRCWRCPRALLVLALLEGLQCLAPACGFCFGLFSTLINHFDIVVKYRRNDRYHVSFHDPRSNTLGAPDSDIDNALERQIPLPHLHHLLAPALFQYTY